MNIRYCFLSLALCGLLVTSYLNVQAQSVYLHAGYNYSAPRMQPVDYIFETYNQNRPYLTQFLQKPGALFGPSFGGGVTAGNLFINLEHTFRTQTVSSAGIDETGFNRQRDMLFRGNTTALSFGAFPETDHTLGFAFGFQGEYGRVQVLTRTGDPAMIEGYAFETVVDDPMVLITPYVQLFTGLTNNVFLHLKPYYQFAALAANMRPLHEYLNPREARMDTEQNFETNFSSFGAQLSIGLAF